jgi:hypothetical protein
MLHLKALLTTVLRKAESGGRDIFGIADYSVIFALICWIGLMLNVEVF